MKNLYFIIEYLLNPRTVGAITPSSKYLTNLMIDQFDLIKAKYIVEYGPGTGAFTDKIITEKGEQTILLLIESNGKFYQLLKNKYENEKNVFIINGTVEYIDKYLIDYGIPYVDYVFSGLPFASLPIPVSETILELTKTILKKEGRFITFQYTRCKRKFISQFFKEIEVIKEYRNLPPAYVYYCKN
ncbi:class I SAM-dependent methyltransferase [Alkalihalobacillus deserti]|uniref:class I SAM-dependent methyltransferase n=1 Tax=Alkalihalobacillus deserti TaxID=2879466 RepID=UPI001D13B46F|nr:rRNA adenine N-6-methyltransferase family protein [Alkalihalobacillus deserti]